MTIRVVGLNLHPVKSTAIRPVASAEVTYAGLAGDRRWMVVDGAGSLVSARELSSLFQVVADTVETDPSLGAALRLRAPGVPPLDISTPDGAPEPVRMFSRDLLGVDAGAVAATWLRQAVHRDDLRLIWCDDPTRRRLNPEFSREGDHAAYPDGYPVTLASLASLRQLNDWLVETAIDQGEPAPDSLPVQRFRPNVVVDGDLEPFEEDAWRGIRLGPVALRVAKPVDRCVMTTIDPVSLDRGYEPIRTLARHRKWDGATWFAAQLIPDTTGRIAVGDEVVPR